MIAVLGILGGAILGTRYKVLCLVPTTAAGAAVIAVLDLINAVSVRSTLQSVLALAVGLQIGYLVSVAARSVLFAARSRHERTDVHRRAAGVDTHFRKGHAKPVDRQADFKSADFKSRQKAPARRSFHPLDVVS
jgi:hypothetical protein